ncbi:unnamed protein product [Clonostachys byssicola]|uniref:Uncharacterized protein n=1 Tax=Clonostachys byssicola TaxID=160290 RepID=A0A9N9U647_9HYPO|nr:unnamed protein product [Clonostachys byssicola]
MTQKDKVQDLSAPEPNHHHVPKQTSQREAQTPEQPPVMSDHEQLQQLQITVMQLERAFHNFVNASSPSHSHKGSFDSAISNQSSLSRPSDLLQSVISPISPKSPDMKDTSLHNPAKTYTSSPLGRPATTSNDSTNNSRTNSITCDSPTTEMSPKQLEGKVKGSRLRKVLSAGSMELLGGQPDIASDGHAVESTGQGATHEARDEERPRTHNISGHGVYGRKIFSKSVDHLAAASAMETPASASSMLRKVGKGMKRKSRTLSELFRPKSAVATGPPNTAFEAESPLTNEPLKSTVATGFPDNTAFEAELPLTKEPLKSPVPETTPSLTWSMDMAKPNFSREDLYEALDTPELGTPESPSFNMYRNYAPVQTQDTGTIQKPGMAPRSILKIPNTPQTETQYDRWVNPFETTDLETLMDALSNVYDYDEPVESVQEVDKYQPPFAPRPISYYL